MHRAAVLLLLLPILISGQEAFPARPAFDAYPVMRIYKGKPAPPRLDKGQRMYGKVIRRGAESPVQFAGHYTVPQFGCGAACSAFFIVDSVSGRVYNGVGIMDLPQKWLERQTGDQPLRIQFVPSSRLLKINGCPNEHDCGYYDFVMVDGKGLKLIQKSLLPKEFQY